MQKILVHHKNPSNGFLGPRKARTQHQLVWTNGKRRAFLCNGKVWEQAQLHLKSAIFGFNRNNIAKQIALDLLKKQV